MKFWDLEDHAFRFNTTELCLTIEEFFAILATIRVKICSSFMWPRHKESLSDALGLPTSITNSMIEGHMVNLHAIIFRLIHKCTYGVTDKCRKTLVWLYALWENFFFALEDIALWVLEL